MANVVLVRLKTVLAVYVFIGAPETTVPVLSAHGVILQITTTQQNVIVHMTIVSVTLAVAFEPLFFPR